MSSQTKGKKKSSISCFNVYFKKAFFSWAMSNYPSTTLSEGEIANCAKKMWDDMTTERERTPEKGVKDGEEIIKFGLSTSLTENSKGYAKFKEEKDRIVKYMQKYAAPYIEKYTIVNDAPLSVKEVKNYNKKRNTEDLMLEQWEGMTKVQKVDFETQTFESESDLLDGLKKAYEASFKEHNIHYYENLQEHISKQLICLETLEMNYNLEIKRMQDIYSLIQSKKAIFRSATEVSKRMYLRLIDSAAFKTKKISTFDDREFCDGVEETGYQMFIHEDNNQIEESDEDFQSN